MKYSVNITVGYYEMDDTFYGPFMHSSNIAASSIEEAVKKARQFLRITMDELGELIPTGSINAIYDDSGELCFSHSQIIEMIFNKPEPSSEILILSDSITTEYIKYLKKHPDKLYAIKPRQFEELTAEILAAYGWEVQLTSSTKDGGYDIFGVSKNESGTKNSWIIECKRYKKENKVGVGVVRALYGAACGLTRQNSAMMLATTSSFTSGAKKYANEQYNFELRDYENILQWINEYKPNPNGKLYIKNCRLSIPTPP